jgi:hypothetical protein
MELCTVSLICGFNVGVQYEIVEDENYVIVSLGFLEVVFTW